MDTAYQGIPSRALSVGVSSNAKKRPHSYFIFFSLDACFLALVKIGFSKNKSINNFHFRSLLSLLSSRFFTAQLILFLFLFLFSHLILFFSFFRNSFFSFFFCSHVSRKQKRLERYTRSARNVIHWNSS